MNPKTLKLLAVATVAVGLLAWLAVRRDVEATRAHFEREVLFPELAERINDVVELEVVTREGNFTVSRTDDGWGLADKGGYPVDGAKVKEAVIQVARFETLERKTERPEKHAALGVADPLSAGTQPGGQTAQGLEAQEPANATLLHLRDAGGTTLASVVLGKERPNRGGGDRSMYVRRAEEDQVWEVVGELRVDGTATNWLDKSILKVEAERVERVEITHPDGEQLVVFKSELGEPNFAVKDMPEGRALKWDGIATAVGRALAYLNLEDVRPLAEVDFSEPTGPRFEYTTFDGLVVRGVVTEVDGVQWSRFEADVDEVTLADLAAAAAAGEEEPDAAEGEEPSAPTDLPEEPAAAGPTPEEVRAEAAALQERIGGWTYALPSWTAQNFDKRMQDMLAEPVEETGAEGDAAALPDVSDLPGLGLDSLGTTDPDQPTLDLGLEPEDTAPPAGESPASEENSWEEADEEPAEVPPGGDG